MNTDVILDFFVEYYIWFIIGGAILLLAIIGFIVEKKGLSSNDKKKQKKECNTLVDSNEIAENNIQHDETILEEKQNNDFNNVEVIANDEPINDENIKNENYFDENDSLRFESFNSLKDENETLKEDEVGNAVTIDSLKKSDDKDKFNKDEQKSFYEKNISDETVLEEKKNNIADNFEMMTNIESISDENVKNENYFDKHENDSLQFEPFNSLKTENETLKEDEVGNSTAIDGLKNIDEKDINNVAVLNNVQFEFNQEKSGNEDSLNGSITNIDEDINKINDMVFDNEIVTKKIENSLETNVQSNIKNDSHEEIIDNKNDDFILNFGDNSSQTVQVNYNQLKEMVEDIIAETQRENDKQNIVENIVPMENVKSVSDNNFTSVNKEGIEDIPLPNLESIKVDAIRQQEEDEDDVWKF